MKRGVEAGHLRNSRIAFADGVDGGERLRHVIGIDRCKAPKVGKQGGRDSLRCLVTRTAMDDTMSNCLDRKSQRTMGIVQSAKQSGSMIPGSDRQLRAGGGPRSDSESAARFADGLGRHAAEFGQLSAVVVERKF